MSDSPCYGALKSFIRQLYRLSLSTLRVPLERFVAAFVLHAPLPPPGGRPHHVLLDLELHTTPRLPPIVLAPPPLASAPWLDLAFDAPFRCLGPDRLLDCLALLLEERCVLFASRVASAAAEVMECLRAMLFPLDWQARDAATPRARARAQRL